MEKEKILPQFKTETEFADLKNKVDTPESIQKKLELAKETGETVEIIREIPIGFVKEKVFWFNSDKIPEEIFVTESLVIFDKNNKRSINFGKFLDKNTIFARFAYNEHFHETTEKDKEIDPYFIEPLIYNKDGEAILKYISYGSLNEDGSRLTLLHEIGHSYEPKKLTKIIFATKYKLEESFENAEEEERKYPTKNEIEIKLRNNKRSRPVPVKNFFKFHQLKSKEERNAWAYAEKILKTLRKTGLDLEPNLNNIEKLEKFVHSERALGGYEINMMKQQIADKTKAKISGLYSKKWYKIFRKPREK